MIITHRELWQHRCIKWLTRKNVHYMGNRKTNSDAARHVCASWVIFYGKGARLISSAPYRGKTLSGENTYVTLLHIKRLTSKIADYCISCLLPNDMHVNAYCSISKSDTIHAFIYAYENYVFWSSNDCCLVTLSAVYPHGIFYFYLFFCLESLKPFMYLLWCWNVLHHWVPIAGDLPTCWAEFQHTWL